MKWPWQKKQIDPEEAFKKNEAILITIEKVFEIPSISKSFHNKDRTDMLLSKFIQGSEENLLSVLGMLEIPKTPANVSKLREINPDIQKTK